jgi:hypothetical protein
MAPKTDVPVQPNTPSAGPYAVLVDTERDVSIWALGNGRHLVVCDGEEQVVEGHDAAHKLAHELGA